MTRDEATEALEAIGADVNGSVSSRTDYLIVGEKPGSKLKKAQALGVAILSEAHLVASLDGGVSPGTPTANPPTTHSGPPVLYVIPRGNDALRAVVKRVTADHAAEILEADEASDVQDRLRALDKSGVVARAVCIVGTHYDLPHVVFEDGTGNDAEVKTDNDYGMLYPPQNDAARHTVLALPDVPVTRIPTTDATLVARLLSVRDSLCDSWKSGVAVTCKVWEKASAEVLRQIATRDRPELGNCPPLSDADIGDRISKSTGRLYFNVHGSDQVRYWVGDGDGRHPAALRVRYVDVAPNAILVSEACYGARHDAGARNISGRFLESGGSAFVGSTIIAWGPVKPPISLADLIVTGVYGALDSGLTLGEALLDAKSRIMELSERGRGVSPQVLNTISSFVAYGGPLARVPGTSKRARIRTGGTGTWASLQKSVGISGPGDVLGRTRSALRGGSGTGPLEAARSRLASRAAAGGWKAERRG